MNNDNLFSANKSKRLVNHISVRNKFINSFYSHMFLEDMCANFSISFSDSFDSRDFFKISPPNSKLNELLNYDNYMYLKYDFDDQLTSLMYNLLLHGKAYAEIALSFNKNKELKKIELRPLYYDKKRKTSKGMKFSKKDHKGDFIDYIIPYDSLIVFDLIDLKIKRNKFKKVMKKLSKIKLPNTELITSKKISFDWSYFKSKEDFNILNICKDTFWYGRKSNNQYLNEIYLLYRIANFNIYRLKFLKYFLGKINSSYEKLGKIYGFEGQIIFNTNVDLYEKALQELNDGKINTTQFGDLIFSKIRKQNS